MESQTNCAQQENPRDENQVSVKDMRKGIFCIYHQPEHNRFMICCDQCGWWFHGDCTGITEEDGTKMVNDKVTFICQQYHQSVDHEPQGELLPRWHPNGPYFDFFPYPVVDVTRPWGSPCDSCGSQCTGHYVTDIPPLLELI